MYFSSHALLRQRLLGDHPPPEAREASVLNGHGEYDHPAREVRQHAPNQPCVPSDSIPCQREAIARGVKNRIGDVADARGAAVERLYHLDGLGSTSHFLRVGWVAVDRFIWPIDTLRLAMI